MSKLILCSRSVVKHCLALLILMGLLSGSRGYVLGETAVSPTAATPTETETTTTVFLPFIKKSGVYTPPPPPPPPATSGGIFLHRDHKTASSSTATDAKGGIHAAYIYYLPDEEPNPAAYAYCAGTDCHKQANWGSVKLLDDTREVQLALTPGGKPRMLIVTDSAVYSGGKDYHYAACDSGCTSKANWKVTRTFSSWGTDLSDIYADSTPQRSFALDGQGRPRFIYQDRNYLYSEPDHYGAFYAYCDSNCNSAASWKQTEVGRFINYDAEIFDLPSLTFTSSGQPRVISRVFALNNDGSSAPEGLYYYECNQACDQTSSWKRLYLLPTGTGSYPSPGWDIELDANNRPRVVLFVGDDIDPASFEHSLLYLWCNSNCLNGANWYFEPVGLAQGNGESPDLALDAQGRPRIAWIDDTGDIGFSWCNVSCQSEKGKWQSKIVETEADLRQEFPQAIPFNCDADVWVAVSPVLALDARGGVRIGYDTAVEAHCLYDPKNGQPPYYRFMPVWRAARVVYFAQP